jgi:serine/threonine protein kinase
VLIKALYPISEAETDVKQFESTSALTITQAFIEVCIMMHPTLMAHQNTVSLFGISKRDLTSKEDASLQLSLVTEYADLGSLESYIYTHQRQMDWDMKTQILRDIASVLVALHQCDIVHNDLKCGNVLLFSTVASSSPHRITAKLTDFGCSVPLAVTNAVRRRGGSLIFAAPEADAPALPSRDGFSFGAIVLHLAKEVPPFLEMDVERVYEVKNDEKLLHKYADDCLVSAPDDVSAAAFMCLHTNANDRPTISILYQRRYAIDIYSSND